MRVGFIGLGLMGSGMTNNLQKAGHQLVLHDLRREAAEKLIANGAEWANSPRELAASAELILTSLPGPPEFDVIDGKKIIPSDRQSAHFQPVNRPRHGELI